MKACPHCSTENEAFFRFCIVCGADLNEGSPSEAPPSKPAVVKQEARVTDAWSERTAEPARPRIAKDTAVDLQPAPRLTDPGLPTFTEAAPTAERAPRVPSSRDKTFDGAAQAKTANPAQQAVGEAQLELAKRQALVKPSELATKRAGSNPEVGNLAPPAPKRVIETPRGAAEAALVPQGPPQEPHSKPMVRPDRNNLLNRTDVEPGRAKLVVILEGGADGATLALNPERTTLGREGADINFFSDDFLAPRHAEFNFEDDGLWVRALPSTNGVFVQVIGETELESGDVFRIGQQLLRFEVLSVVASVLEPDPRGQAIPLGSPIPEGAWGRLSQLITPERTGAVYLLGGTEVYLGRERGDITFPGDGFVSGLHAQLTYRQGRCFLKDLGSSNGTYMRIKQPMPVKRGTLLLAGQQLFRIDQG